MKSMVPIAAWCDVLCDSGRYRWHPRLAAEQHGEDFECVDVVLAGRVEIRTDSGECLGAALALEAPADLLELGHAKVSLRLVVGQRSGRHPGPEAVGQGDEDPRLTEGDGADRHHHHA